MLAFADYYGPIFAKGEDVEVWVQLLIFIIIGVVAALKSIAGKGAGKPQKAKEQQPQRFEKQVQNRSILSRAENYLHAQEAAAKTAAEKYAELLRAKRQKKMEKAVTPMQPQQQVQQSPSLKLPKKEETEHIFDLDLHEAESLRKAIIYHEIFGKPISLRE